jgi:uncharacterized protein
MQVAVVCVALMVLLLVGLGMGVSAARWKYATGIGAPDDPRHPMLKIVRAHGNAAEWIPILALMMLWLGTREPAAWVIWAMTLVTACRFSHAVGMVTCHTLAGPHPLRFIGSAGTYLGGIALAIAMFAEQA